MLRDCFVTGDTSGYFTLSTEHLLLRREEFNEAAIQYIQSHESHINLRDLFSSYIGRVEAFYDWLHVEIEKHLPPEVVDYRRCMQAIKKHFAASELRILLGVVGAQKGDPYKGLERFLTEEQLAEVMSMQRGSAGQAERIIELLDDEGVCTPELRQLFHERFGVRR